MRVQEEVFECAAVVLFFLLVAALPAGSYFFLHRSLVSRYEQLADTLQQQASEVGSDIQHALLAHHMYSYIASAHPDSKAQGPIAEMGCDGALMTPLSCR